MQIYVPIAIVKMLLGMYMKNNKIPGCSRTS